MCILRGENRVTEQTKHFFSTVLLFFILFMLIWCQNNSSRSQLSERPNAQAVTIKHSYPAYQYASVLAEHETLLNILLSHGFGQVTKFRFVQDLGERTEVRWL